MRCNRVQNQKKSRVAPRGWPQPGARRAAPFHMRYETLAARYRQLVHQQIHCCKVHSACNHRAGVEDFMVTKPPAPGGHIKELLASCPTGYMGDKHNIWFPLQIWLPLHKRWP